MVAITIQLKGVGLLGVVHTLGNLLTNMSLGAVAVSFTHTIKAMEPFFSVVLSGLFLGDVPSAAVLLTLVPIVGGVALASLAGLYASHTIVKVTMMQPHSCGEPAPVLSTPTRSGHASGHASASFS